MRSVFLEHPSSLDHQTGHHPEQPARMTAIQEELSRRDWLGFERMESPAVDPEVLHQVHPADYVEALERVAARGGGALDQDTFMSAGSYLAAMHAAGGAVRVVDLLLDRDARYAFSAHRPPGHHALQKHPMGFCLFNNVAVAAAFALRQRGLDRVMVLDWDVHHGNGTNDIFHVSEEVLFVSIHQWPFYPGTGPAEDVGSGAGRGYTVNLPVPEGAGDEVFRSLVEHVALPLARQYEPQLVLISAGYDAHFQDPLGQCEVTEAGFAAMTQAMVALCAERDIPLGFVLEGGYGLAGLARSVAATMEVLADPESAPADGVPMTALARRALDRLAPFWPGLGD